MAFKLRSQNSIGTPLSWQEMDDNLSYLLTNMSGSFLTLSGNISVKNNISISGSLIISQSLNVNNTSSFNNINPINHNTYDLGLPSSYWRNGYINNVISNTITASYISGSISHAVSSSYSTSASYALNSLSSSYSTSASYALNSLSSSYSTNSTSASYSTNSTSASYSTNSISSSYSLSASYAPNSSIGNPVTTILMANGMISYSDLISYPISSNNVLDIASTSTKFYGSSRVKLSASIINHNTTPNTSIIPKFHAKIIGEFSCSDKPTFNDPDIQSAGSGNTFQITGLHFMDNKGDSLGAGGLSIQDFNYNYYNKSKPGDTSLNYGFQIETEWILVNKFKINNLYDGFLNIMYIANLGDRVNIERLILLLKEE